MAPSQTQKAVAAGIVDFLHKAIADKSIPSDDVESVEVAIECLTGVFDVSEGDKAKLLGSHDLESLVAKALASPASTSAPTTSAADEAGPSAEDKAAAEKFKLEGNRAMAQREYQQAVDLYTKAIEADGTNAVYFSNRSAAYSSLRDSDSAAEDARKAIAIDPKYSKAYSRLGLALYSLGDAVGAMEAYKKGLDLEGEKPSDGMKRGYETAKKRVEEDLGSDSTPTAEATATRGGVAAASASSGNNSASATAGGMPGMPDLSSLAGMFGGGGGGGGGMPDLSSLMSNPAIASMAQNLMSNPGMMSNLMSNPTVQRMQERMSGGQMPNMSEIMSDPSLRDLASGFLGGNSNADAESEE